MTSVVATALAGVLGLAGLTACGSADLGGREGSVPSAKTPASPSPSSSSSPSSSLPEDLVVPPRSPGAKPPKSPGAGQSTIRVRGTVSEGVEPGCRLLSGQGAVYLLILRQGTVSTGQKVEVEGTVRPDLATTCQQGTPLVVERIVRL